MPSYASRDDDLDPYTSDSTLSSDDEEENRGPRPSHRPVPSSSSSKLYLMVGTVVVLLAAIGATSYIMTREGGVSSFIGGESSPATVATVTPSPSKLSSLTVSPKETPEVGTSGGVSEEDEEEEEDECDLCADEGDEEPAKAKPSKTSDSDESTPASTGKPSTDKPSTDKPSTDKPSSSLGTLYGENLMVDFSTLKSASELSSFLSENGLRVSTDEIGSEPITHTFLTENIDWEDGALRLLVTGQAGNGDIKSAEFTTTESILYGRVTTRMKASPVPGTCHGIFFYTNDNLEIDIELLTSYYTEGLGDAVKPGLQLTNQSLKPGGKSTNMVVPYGFDPTLAWHDYTISWEEGVSIFEVDGVEVGRLEENVPSEPMKFIWNNWSSAEPNWSAGPPRADNYMLISAIAANWTVSK